jgi:serine/threonine protein kinase
MIGEYIGNYRLTRLLGEGGMGMVYQAVHDGVGGQAAIKVLRPEVAQKKDATTRLFNEARAANSIPHPGIVRIFDCGYTSQGIAYLAMEYLEGESLRTRIDRERSLDVPDALRIARQIASVLQAAHSRQVVHRDLKPDNIMLVPDPELPGGERVKLLDFGVAKLAETLNAEPMLTRSDMLMGTPTYMAPEQCRGAKHVTDRSDVYSLGVILYQLIAGVPPFTGETVGELIAMHLTDSEPQLVELIPGIDPTLAALVHSMLRKKAGERPSVDEVAQSLKRLLMDISQAEGISPGQARRMASESAIPIAPPLSPQAQALLKGNTAPPTLAGNDSGQHPRLPSAAKNAPTDQKSPTDAGAVPAPVKPSPAPADRKHSIDPALSSTWDGEAVSRHVPAARLAAATQTAEANAAPATARPAPGSVPSTIDPEATPPIAAVQPATLASADTPKRGEMTPASAPDVRPSLDRAALTIPTPVISARRPWRLVGGLLIAASVLLFLLLRSLGTPQRPDPDPSAPKQPATFLVRTTPLSSVQLPKAGDLPPTPTPGPESTLAAPDPRPSPTQPDAGSPASAKRPDEPAKIADVAPTGSKPVPARDESKDSATGNPASDGKLDSKKAAVGPDPAQATAFAALRSKQYAEAQRLSQSCVDKQPQNIRCWWMLGVAACQTGDNNHSSQAQARLTALGRGALAREVSQACGKKGGAMPSDTQISLRLSDEKSEWLNSASRLFELGRHLQAQQLAEKNLAQDPVEAWSMIGRAACALGDEEKANLSLSKINDKSAKSDIVHYCIGRGFAFNLGNGTLSKRK